MGCRVGQSQQHETDGKYETGDHSRHSVREPAVKYFLSVLLVLCRVNFGDC